MTMPLVRLFDPEIPKPSDQIMISKHIAMYCVLMLCEAATYPSLHVHPVCSSATLLFHLTLLNYSSFPSPYLFIYLLAFSFPDSSQLRFRYSNQIPEIFMFCRENMSDPSLQFSKTVLIPFKDIDIPTRKLLCSHHNHNVQDMQLPYATSAGLLHKYLPSDNYEGDEDSDDIDGGDPYAADHFRMYEFKVRRCTRSRSHDWTDCPFAHPGEKARRRDPRRFHYSSTICSDFRRGGGCPRGDDCDFAHGVFECWLHPTRYRTEACKDGKNCKRKVCFFAHSARELRLLPAADSSPKYKNSSAAGSCSSSSINSPMNRNRNNQHCCLFCHSVMTSSPTSTLLGLSHLSRSPSSSPPVSPMKQRTGFSPISRYSDRLSKFGTEMINELMMMSSLENMNICDDQVSSPVVNRCTAILPSWIDVTFNDEDQAQQFLLSPSSSSSSSCRPSPASGTPSAGEYCFGTTPINNGSFVGNDHKQSNENGGTDPDLGWVNELLM